ncbi:hypothetical protein ACLMJK_000429 [Lecanora helva]
MTAFDITIVSDTVCPWKCYVGKKKLERGISLYKSAHPDSNDTFSTTWKPFYLNPEAPKVSVDKQEFYKSKFGEAKAETMFSRMTMIGKDVGINFSFGGRTGNTRDSHRLIQLGKSKGPHQQTRVVEELFTSYFEKAGDITSHDMLLEASVKAGLSESEAKAWLESDNGGREVDEEVADAQARRVSGVPNFLLQSKYEIGGAQDAEAFARAFEKIKDIEGS